MTDDSNIFDGTDEPVEPTQETNLNETDVNEDEETQEIPAEQHVITVRSSAGGSRYVPVSEGQTLTVAQVMLAANLTPNGQVTYWLNGAEITPTTPVPADQTLTVIGSVKGG